MAEASTSTTSTSGHIADSHITEGTLRLILPGNRLHLREEADHFADEASLYDRQIRLWGLEAQNR